MDVRVIPGRGYDSNIYVIPGKVPTIVDTGTGFFSTAVVETIQKITPLTQISQILLTHEHFDHVGGVTDFVQMSKGTARIYAHQNVVQKLKEGKSAFAEMLGGKMPKITVDVPLTDGTELSIGDRPYEVLYTPGHSIGSLCFYGWENKVLFSGDTIFSHGDFGRYDFPGGDFTALVQSITRLAGLEVADLYPGHGPYVERQGKDHVLFALENIRSLV
jgi:glyoxylase-like metal-dependent hydrolase (beta-lactamase superfamily II)